MRPQATCYTCYNKWETTILGRTKNPHAVRIIEKTCPRCGSEIIGVSRGRGTKPVGQPEKVVSLLLELNDRQLAMLHTYLRTRTIKVETVGQWPVEAAPRRPQPPPPAAPGRQGQIRVHKRDTDRE